MTWVVIFFKLFFLLSSFVYSLGLFCWFVCLSCFVFVIVLFSFISESLILLDQIQRDDLPLKL